VPLNLHEGKAILLSTHTMSEAEKLCDRIAIIHRGVILALSDLETLRKWTGKHYLEDIFVQYVQELPGAQVLEAGSPLPPLGEAPQS
jgi:ABC-type Na+ transport system ATPase subunit NatA